MPRRPPIGSFQPRLKNRNLQRRGSASRRGYGRRWQRLRKLVLAGEPLCRACAAEGRTTAATEVDHVTPLSAGGTNEQANLQPLCKSHHSRKTAHEAGTFGRAPSKPRVRGCDVDGTPLDPEHPWNIRPQ